MQSLIDELQRYTKAYDLSLDVISLLVTEKINIYTVPQRVQTCKTSLKEMDKDLHTEIWCFLNDDDQSLDVHHMIHALTLSQKIVYFLNHTNDDILEEKLSISKTDKEATIHKWMEFSKIP